jgi:hypothetical protein
MYGVLMFVAVLDPFISLNIFPHTLVSHRVNPVKIVSCSKGTYAAIHRRSIPLIDKARMDCAQSRTCPPLLEIYGVCWTLPRWLDTLELKRIPQLPLFNTHGL